MYTEPAPGTPVTRAPWRLAAGKAAFRALRHLAWWRSRLRGELATERQATIGEAFFTHETPVMRALRDVDMSLQRNKVINLRRAIEAIDGVVIRPGQTFSFWYLVGPPTRARGFVDGLVLSGGRLTRGVGGGLCQLSNLLYWMVLHSPLEVRERYRHSYDVFPDRRREIPFGAGATVAYNYVDLQVHNPTDRSIQLKLSVDKRRLAGALRSEAPPTERYEIYEASHTIEGPLPEGYRRRNEVRRRVFGADGALVRDEHVAKNDALMMYHPLLSDGGAPRSFVDER